VLSVFDACFVQRMTQQDSRNDDAVSPDTKRFYQETNCTSRISL
jgi:hypothetical protein